MILYVVLLFILFLGLVVAEAFLPSGGILGVLATGALIAAIALSFSHSPMAGAISTITAVFIVPMAIYAAIRIWPYTPVGRSIINVSPDAAPLAPAADPNLEALVGMVGTAKTDLLPGGLAVILGNRYDVVCVGSPINAGDAVKVSRIDTNKVLVSATDEPPTPITQPVAASPSPTSTEPASPNVDQELLDSFDFEDV
ncbi:MAG: NfeD family protein [Planctomycetota bacterium]